MTPLDCPTTKKGANKKSAQLSFTVTELYRFEVPVSRNANFFKLGHKKENVTNFNQKNIRNVSGVRSLRLSH